MGHERAATPTQAVAQRVRDLRKRRGLTAQQLAEKMVEQGIAWQRSTVAKLENGSRENVTLAEFLALAVVLDVAPVHLLVPLDAAGVYAVTPETTAQSTRVRDWVRGMTDLPGTDPRTFYSEVPADEWGAAWLLVTLGAGAMPPAKAMRRAYTGYGNPHLIGDGEDGEG